MRKLEDMSLEELILLREEEDERLNKNPLDSAAISRYNYLSQLIKERYAQNHISL
jgi:hypothetical protein